nr:MAG TPA: hypothetical protein [Caudoviricetes sp.]
MRSFLFFLKYFTTVYIEREVNKMNKKNEDKDMTWWQFLLGLWILDLFF